MATILKGDNVTFSLDGVDFMCSAKSITVTSAENTDATTFCGRKYDYTMTISGLQSDDEDGLFGLFWDNSGDVVDWELGTNGTVGRTFSGKVRLPHNKPDFGGDAFATWGFDVTMDVIGEPVRSALPAGGA